MTHRGFHSQLIVLFLLCLLSAGVAQSADDRFLLLDDFTAGFNPGWKHEKFSGRTDYSIVEETGNLVLRGESRGTASALVCEKKIRLQEYPILSWRWKIADILADGDARTKEGDDYPARIYVVFPHWFVPKTRSINYIWANKLPQGTELPNSYTANSILIATQSGRARAGQWVSERHNVAEDYRRIFGEEPPTVGAIAIMTDSDDTKSRSIAWFDDLRFERE